jgi:hypothetical protein
MTFVFDNLFLYQQSKKKTLITKEKLERDKSTNSGIIIRNKLLLQELDSDRGFSHLLHKSNEYKKKREGTTHPAITQDNNAKENHCEGEVVLCVSFAHKN